MSVQVLQNIDTSYLDRLLLDDTGRMRLFPAATYRDIPYEHLRVWTHKNARYQIPTKELIDWLREQIAGRTAIEVCSGMGDVGHHLGIPMTDSGIQTTPVVALHYSLTGQPTITPPPDVERIDAESAVAKYKPQVVVACWLTQKFQNGDTHGSVYGPDECKIRENCEHYILVGNENTHGDKRVRRFKHATHRPPWLVSRAIDPSKNVIYTWGQ